MSAKKRTGHTAQHKKQVEPEAKTRGKLRLAIALVSIGIVLVLTGLLLGRGASTGSALFGTRFFMLVVGLSLVLAGAVGLLAHVLVVGANKQVNRKG